MSNKFKKILFVFTIVVSIFLFLFLLYISGGISYIVRMREVYLCNNSKKMTCNQNLTLTGERDLQPSSQVTVVSGNSMVFKRVVMGFMIKDRLLAWSADKVWDWYRITDKTTFGIAAVVDENDLKNGNKTSLTRDTQKKLSIQALKDNQLSQKYLVIEGNPGKLNQKGFQEIAKSGNLLEIIYKANSNELVGVILVDFNLL